MMKKRKRKGREFSSPQMVRSCSQPKGFPFRWQVKVDSLRRFGSHRGKRVREWETSHPTQSNAAEEPRWEDSPRRLDRDLCTRR